MTAFEIDDLRDQLLAASDEGEFLLLIYKASLDNRHSNDTFTEELAKLHNEGSVDVISAFRSLQNNPDTGVDFWLTRHMLEKVLPKLDAPILQVMECVLHLVKEAGQDMAAGTLISPFIDFCAAHTSRPEEALKLIKEFIDKYVAFLGSTLIAGARGHPYAKWCGKLEVNQPLLPDSHAALVGSELQTPYPVPEYFRSVVDPHVFRRQFDS